MLFCLCFTQPRALARRTTTELRITAMNALTVFSMLFAFAIVSEANVVRIESGMARGGTKGSANVYYGIPYAGTTKRFSLPQPLLPTNETNNYTMANPKYCAQFELKEGLPFDVNSTEDCLTLNVHTPHDANENSSLPVLVYIGGDFFVAGSSNDVDGSVLASNQKVVVVTFNYRLGAFGFLGNNKINISQNLGVEDAKAVLKWVNRNIKGFGGSAGMVTIAGNSIAGATITSLLLADPDVQSLYKRVMLWSGSWYLPFSPLTQEDMAMRIEMMKNALGCSSDDVKACLEKQEASKLATELKNLSHHFPALMVGPVTEVELKTRIQNMNLTGKDFLIGMQKQEASFLQHYQPFLGTVMSLNFSSGISQNDFKSLVYKTKILKHGTNSTSSALIYEYTNWEKRDERIETLKGFLNLLTDGLFRIPALKMAEDLEKKNVSVYVFQLNEKEKMDIMGRSVPEFVDVPYKQIPMYLFGDSTVMNNTGKEGFISGFQKQMVEFVITGNPNENKTHGKWPKYSSENRQVYQAAFIESGVSSDFLAQKADFWTRYLPQTEEMPTTPGVPPVTIRDRYDEDERIALICLTVIFGVFLLICIVALILMCCVRKRSGSKSMDSVYYDDKGPRANAAYNLH